MLLVPMLPTVTLLRVPETARPQGTDWLSAAREPAGTALTAGARVPRPGIDQRAGG